MTEQRFQFDAIAADYARVRPDYPAALIDDLIAGAGLQPDARLLELGSGPGTATAPFVERGFSLTCIEPGPRLGDVARERFAGDRVEVVTSTFEEWALEPGAFDLCFAAQSFHWIDPSVRCVKARAALKDGGTLAIFANRPEHADSPLDHAIQAIYAEQTPQLTGRGVMTNTSANFRAILDGSGLFAPATCREYTWTASYATAEYLTLLGTHSDHRMLAGPVRRRLLDSVGEAIEAHGGVFQMPHVAVLAHARTL